MAEGHGHATAPVGHADAHGQEDHPTHDGEHIHLPSPSIWPMALAAGVTLVGFGMVSSFVFSLAGVLLMVRAMAGWIGELRHE